MKMPTEQDLMRARNYVELESAYLGATSKALALREKLLREDYEDFDVAAKDDARAWAQVDAAERAMEDARDELYEYCEYDPVRVASALALAFARVFRTGDDIAGNMIGGTTDGS